MACIAGRIVVSIGCYWISAGSLVILLAYRVRDPVLKKILSVSQFIRQRVQALSQGLKSSRPIPVVPTEKRIPEALLREQAVSSVSSVDKTIIPAITLLKPCQMMSEGPEQRLQDEKTRPRTLETAATEKRSQSIADSPWAVSKLPVSEAGTRAAAFVEKYEMGTAKNKINVRIFKEPPTELVIEESQNGAKINQVDMKTLVQKLKEELTETPIQPSPRNHILG